jgi:beta-phosphoglucomutase
MGRAGKSPKLKKRIYWCLKPMVPGVDRTAEPDDLLSGSLELLKKLQEKGIKIGLGSASKNAMGILVKTGIITYFDALIDGNVVQLSKPNPEVFLKGAAVLEIEPTHCLVLEDARLE